MEFSHIDKKGNASMVDVSNKKESVRSAEANATVLIGNDVYGRLQNQSIEKGDVLSVARIAGIQAAKKTSALIPLCHNIFISKIDIQFTLQEENHSVHIYSTVKTTSVTGVEMEALTAVSVAALTIYDMCKAINKSIVITDIHVVSKSGGASGNFQFRKEK